jgi:hypothetical protein
MTRVIEIEWAKIAEARTSIPELQTMTDEEIRLFLQVMNAEANDEEPERVMIWFRDREPKGIQYGIDEVRAFGERSGLFDVHTVGRMGRARRRLRRAWRALRGRDV